MKITAKSLAIIALIIALIGALAPAAIILADGNVFLTFNFGMIADLTDGDMSPIGKGNIWFYWAPMLPVLLVIGVGHLLASLLSKTANKQLNRAIAGDIYIVVSLIYFASMYCIDEIFLMTIPLGMLFMVAAGPLSLWAGRLAGAEETPRQLEGSK